MNLYATKKTAAEGMLDIALFLANITHMKTVIEQGAGYRYWLLDFIFTVAPQKSPTRDMTLNNFFFCIPRYYVAVLTLISFSLALQIVAGVLIIIIGEPFIKEKSIFCLSHITTLMH